MFSSSWELITVDCSWLQLTTVDYSWLRSYIRSSFFIATSLIMAYLAGVPFGMGGVYLAVASLAILPFLICHTSKWKSTLPAAERLQYSQLQPLFRTNWKSQESRDFYAVHHFTNWTERYPLNWIYRYGPSGLRQYIYVSAYAHRCTTVTNNSFICSPNHQLIKVDWTTILRQAWQGEMSLSFLRVVP